ncbi:MAG: molybdopterin cofactor-binding domain-containing protein [Candidatus Fermentibacteria bacterium]|nr:molybdopterin cofactor-binding domain-containing protein [Candidatus Fermentibacteria bacterium]
MKHFDAILHVKGESIFVADIPEPEGTLHAAVFTSPCAHGNVLSLNTSEAGSMPGVFMIITADDIPGENEIGNIIMDEPLLAGKTVHFIGEPVAVVLADTSSHAHEAMKTISMKLHELKAVSDPREAAGLGDLIVPPRTFSCGNTVSALKECTHIIRGKAETGGQEHLYLETQSALCVPGEGNVLHITSSTQSPSFVQKIAARVLGLPMHMIQVNVPRLGGAFGGKEDQATPWAVIAALGSHLSGRAVRLILKRSEDLVCTGKRHPYSYDFTIGLNAAGRILVWKVDYYQNSGAVSDLSTAILERSLFHSTGSYFVPNVLATGYCCRTNLAPNTAFRGFGAPQAMFVMEAAIHKASVETGIPVEVIQETNLLLQGDSFPYGMEYSCNEVRNSWNLAGKFSGIEESRRSFQEFNRKNRYFKKGIAVMPVCFGISFTTTFLNQASALVHVYTDGSVGISTGAVEMGQGVNSRIRQVAAEVFSIPVERTKVESTNTSRTANTSPTAASSGADMNGNAALIACKEIRTRLLQVAADKLDLEKENLCLKDSSVWNSRNRTELSWDQLVAAAYMNRTDLSSHAHYATPGISFDKTTEKGKPFAYHVAGTAVTEVTVDCMLGTYEVNRVSIVHQGGNQLNPLVDRGQVEGALLQGIGWVTMEELAWDGKTKRLLADTLATYKVPDINFTPDEVNILFAEGEKLEDGVGLKGSKAIGEPPFMYGIGTWFAILQAARAFNPEVSFDYTTPITPERVLMALTEGREN